MLEPNAGVRGRIHGTLGARWHVRTEAMIRKTLLVISLVLLAGTVGVWVRSYYIRDAFIHSGDGHVAGLAIDRGWVRLAVFRGTYDELIMTSRHPKWVSTTVPCGFRRVGQGMRVSILRDHPRDPAFWSIAVFSKPHPWMWNDGFAANAQKADLPIPCWLLFCIFSSWPVGGPVCRFVVARRRRAKGRCVHCDYSLTGNVSGACPECGTPFKTDRNARTERQGSV